MGAAIALVVFISLCVWAVFDSPKSKIVGSSSLLFCLGIEITKMWSSKTKNTRSGDKHSRNTHAFYELDVSCARQHAYIFKSINVKVFWKAVHSVSMGVWNLDRKHLR